MTIRRIALLAPNHSVGYYSAVGSPPTALTTNNKENKNGKKDPPKKDSTTRTGERERRVERPECLCVVYVRVVEGGVAGGYAWCLWEGRGQ